MRRALVTQTDRIGLDIPIITPAFDAVADVVSSAWDRVPGHEIIDDATAPIGDVVKWWWDTFKYVNIWTGPQLWFSETAYKIVRDINEGKPVGRAVGQNLSEQGKEYARSLQKAAPYIAMVPGIGTGLAIAMNSAAAIALGQPMDKVAVDTMALAVPGGAVAQQAFRTGATLGAGMLKGQSFDEAAVSAIREALPSEQAKIAFDAALALARGKSLQDAGFQILYYYTKGNELVDRAAHFAEAVAKGAREGKSVGQVLAQEATTDLAKLGGSYRDRMASVEQLGNRILARDEVNDVAKALVETQDQANAFQALANRYSVPPDVVRTAMAALTWEKIPGVNVVVPRVDEGKLQEMDPIRKNLRTPVAKAVRNTRMIRPAIKDIVMPPWLAQPEASIASYDPPHTLSPPVLSPPSEEPSRFMTSIVAPALLTFPFWLPFAATAAGGSLGWLARLASRRP